MADENNNPTAAPAAGSAAPESTAARTAFSPVPPASAERSGSTAIAWLALLLVLFLAAAGVWALLEAQQRESQLRERLQAIEAGAGSDVSVIDPISRNLQRQVELEVAAAQTTLRGEWQDQVEKLREQARQLAGGTDETRRLQLDVDRRVSSLQEALAGARQSLEEKLAALESQLARQRARLDRFSADDRESWLLAEAQHLIRLANQRLIMTGDTGAAGALLRSADNLLQELDGADLRDVRRALAADMLAVRAVSGPDLEGIYLRLGALIEQTASLAIFSLPEPRKEPAVTEAGDWRGRLRLGYERALEKLSSYVVFRRRDVSPEALMDPQWEAMLRQNLRLLIEQAQLALLSGNPRLFRESLQRARDWLGQFPGSDETAAGAMLRELEDLEATPISVDAPDASKTLQAMQAVMAARKGDRDAGP
ncbi:uroporphyrin-3 C-methyltransferase [Chromatocurvus halotolerans]|uniref:Uroporphyrin-3 C-methyltransferase n=1 Tax=Chromatocurvus halotolerans TaxID=1132028 RepID=A0A4R2KWJ8_9GAMM|nr:uroporphyrin-3 C-methyltransferase [Chromatocurvus halotolerans]